METPSHELIELAHQYNVATSFTDWKGRHSDLSVEAIRAVLQALDVNVDAPGEELQRRRDEQWLRVLPACTVLTEGDPGYVNVHVPAGEGVEVWLELETGERAEAWQVENWEADRWVQGQMRGEATFSLGTGVPIGYHWLMARSNEGEFRSAYIVTPRSLALPRSLGESQAWGYATQLYSVLSEGSWGMGDFVDLADMAAWAGACHGSDYILINPVHAAQPVPPLEPSPYLPSSRRFMSPLYIRPEAIDEYWHLPAAQRATVDALREGLSSKDQIDRNSSWHAKREALLLIFEQPLPPFRKVMFDAFRKAEGEGLELFAIWSALSERFGCDWRIWPEEFQAADSEAVATFAAEHSQRVEFYAWLQWIAQSQLASAQATAKEAGMALGIVGDLAVGVSSSGAETWLMNDVFAAGVTVGAPPDQYNQMGQDWGQPPWRPDKLAELAYEPFRAMVRAALRRTGGLRIDHVMGLFRLWWVPRGMAPTSGAYVRYDHEALVGILILEASRAEALVVGEDLGTVEPWVREYLASRGILGTSVLWFEYDSAGQPLIPQLWREQAMASVTTHDMPPTLGYLAGDHIRLADKLGLLTESFDEELAAARRTQQEWLDVLAGQGLITPGEQDPETIMLALHALLRRAPSRLLLAALTDAVGERLTQNQPGTIDEYPNWRVPLRDQNNEPVRLEQLIDAPLPAKIADLMNQV